VFFEVAASTTPGVEQTLLSLTIPALTTRFVHQVVVVCRMEGSFRVLSDSSLIGSGRTGAAQSNVAFNFSPPRPLLAGSVLDVLFESRPNSPVVDVEVFVQAADSQD
jgi:hypothetical protein